MKKRNNFLFLLPFLKEGQNGFQNVPFSKRKIPSFFQGVSMNPKFILFLGVFMMFCMIVQSEQIVQDRTVYTYTCAKIPEKGKIVIDGKLSEKEWQKAAPIFFKEMKTGAEPEYFTVAKLLWDETYLYIGCEMEDSDIWVRASLKDDECPKSYVERVNIHRNMPDAEWHRLECDIMTFDNFFKIFLDPDADTQDYLEFHINSVNNIFDAWYKEGLVKPNQVYLESPNVSWTCPKILSATSIEGTINFPQDIDRGWSFEMAIPWQSLKQFIKKKCPPVEGDVWGMMLGRIHRDYSWSPERFYWTWPVVGEYVSHKPSLYGKLVFSERFVEWKKETKEVKKVLPKRTPVLFVSGGGIPEQIIPEAKNIGASGFMCSAYPVEMLKRFVVTGKKYNVDIYATLSLADIELWKQKMPGINPPLQKMSPDEIQAYQSLKDKNTRFATNYQWGEEPKGMKTEVLIQELLCFHDERVKNFFKERIKEILEIEDLKGIGFDFFGYQNYRCCLCDVSESLFKEFYEKRKDLTVNQARDEFSLETLISFYNELSDYARSLKPDIKIMTHIYPYFRPQPFYGNRLDIDYCGYTVAWFLPWNLARVARYTKKILDEEKSYFKRNNAVAMFGYYHEREMFPTKSPERVEKELEVICEKGTKYVLVHSINDVLKSQKVKEIFTRYFKK